MRTLNANDRLNPRVTFAVDDVQPADKPVYTESLAQSLAKRFRRKVLVLPNPEQSVTNVVNRCHPLIDAVHMAFSQHRPLTLSPDCIWSVIAQGFSHHISGNAETLRRRLVRHQGRIELVEAISSWRLDEIQRAIAGFSSQICEATDPVLHETLICDFSTTTPAIRTASEVVLMDTYSSYFEYLMLCICGIPSIAITGSLEDWQRIRARIEVLETFDLGWWTNRLRPIIDEFIHAVAGEPTREFWQAIYKPRKSYGETSVTGWIADLFPYLNDAPARRRNHVLNHERQNWEIPADKGVESRSPVFDPGAEKGAGLASFPSGLTSVPLQLKFKDGSTAKADLVAGFFAVEQDAKDLALSPVISWCLAEPAPATPVLI